MVSESGMPSILQGWCDGGRCWAGERAATLKFSQRQDDTRMWSICGWGTPNVRLRHILNMCGLAGTPNAPSTFVTIGIRYLDLPRFVPKIHNL
jgi:hypothetical protein